MKSFTTVIVNIMKKEKLFAPQGGPIIMAQASSDLFLYGQLEGPKFWPYRYETILLSARQNVLNKQLTGWIIIYKHYVPGDLDRKKVW